MTYSVGSPFSTLGADNSNNGCEEFAHGAWWYKGCFYSSLNGVWNGALPQAISWYWNGIYEFLKTSTMMMRPSA